MFDYDDKSAKSIKQYAEKLIWKQILSILPKGFKTKKSNKWWIWQLIELYHFWKKLDNSSQPDFHEAWVELKVTPIKRIKKWDIRSKERLVLNVINYNNIINENWENSTFIKKNSLILLMIYLYEEDKLNIEYVMKIVEFLEFQQDKEDYEIIKNDWKIIQNKIKEWKAHELSEWDTQYLWACTKWSAWWNPRPQPNSDILAKQRAFSFKWWYMNYILKKIEWKETRYEKLFNNTETVWVNFENELKKLFEPYIWKTAFEIWNMLNLEHKNQKSYYAMLSNKIMKVTSEENTEEFIKHNINLKTIRIKPDWNLAEDVSLPTFKSKKIVKQEWLDSDLYNMLEWDKFFFVIYKIQTENITKFRDLNKTEKDKALILDRVILWNTPWNDIELKAKKTWEKTIELMKNWVTITPKEKKYKDWYRTDYYNDLPSKSETNMIHVRPHASDSSYRDELPDWQTITKSCFWLNSDYIKKELWI